MTPAGISPRRRACLALLQRRALRIAFQYLRDAADADEAVQDAFVKVFSHIGAYREAWPFEVWFTRILINGCLDRRNLRGRERRQGRSRQGRGLVGRQCHHLVGGQSTQVGGAELGQNPDRALRKSQRHQNVKTNMNPQVYQRRKMVNRIGLTLSMLAMVLGLSVLLAILWVLFKNGFAALDWAMFTEPTPAPGSDGGGLANAIVGSLLMITFTVLVSTPVGILAGIYLAEYGDESKTAEFTRFVTDIMLSAPSIVLGLFVYALWVSQVKHFSGWAGSMALSLIAIPVVVRTTENMLRLVPGSLREAAFALGAPRWKVATMVTLRAARSGVITGLLLALARISGETAPLLFTALNNQFMSFNMNAPMANLPVVIYQFAMSPYDNWVRLAWGGALIITLAVLVLNVIARVFFRDKSSG